MGYTHTSSSTVQPDPGSGTKLSFSVSLVQLAESTLFYFCPKLLRGAKTQCWAEFSGSQTISLLVCKGEGGNKLLLIKYQNVMALSVPSMIFKTHVSPSCCSAHVFALSLSLEVPFLRSNSVWPVVKLGSPSAIGKSAAEVAFPSSDPSPALQVLSNIVGSGPAAGLAVINKQMACSTFSDLAKHIPFTFFLHSFQLFFIILGEHDKKEQSSSRCCSGQYWGVNRGCCALLLISTRVIGRGC